MIRSLAMSSVAALSLAHAGAAQAQSVYVAPGGVYVANGPVIVTPAPNGVYPAPPLVNGNGNGYAPSGYAVPPPVNGNGYGYGYGASVYVAPPPVNGNGAPIYIAPQPYGAPAQVYVPPPAYDPPLSAYGSARPPGYVQRAPAEFAPRPPAPIGYGWRR